MKNFSLLALATSLTVTGFSQSVGIGTTTPYGGARLHVVGNNTDTSFGALIDGNVLGTGLQVLRGGIGSGPYLPSSRLFAATLPESTLPMDSVAAIIGLAASAPSGLSGGVLGALGDDAETGIGVQGLAFGIPYASFFGDQYLDAGVYGSGTIGTLGLGGIGVNGIGNVYGVYAELDNLTTQAPTTQYALYATSSNARAATRYAGYFDGNVTITGSIAKGSGTFKIDNPADPANKYLYHSFVESPDMMNIYNGNITTDANGFATVTMPSYFDALNKDFRYQLTSIGSFAQAIVKEEINGNSFVIQTSQPNTKVSWQVTGVRKDKYAEAHRVEVEVEKEPWNKGLYLHAKEFGLDEKKSIGYQDRLNLKMAPGVSQQSIKLKAKNKNSVAPALRLAKPATTE